MKELWKSLAGWKLDGLTIEATKSEHDGSDTFDIRYKEDLAYIVGDSTTNHWHRAALLLVVDAIEAAGKAWLEREVISIGTSSQDIELRLVNDHSILARERLSDHNNNEASTLLALLVQVRSSMNG